MRVKDNDGQWREFGSDFLDVADAHTGIEQQRSLVADDEVADDFLELMGLVNRKDRRRDFVNFKPGIAHVDALQLLVFGARESPAPIWNCGLRRHCCGPGEQTEENSQN